jgi:putative tryptophan/tyrosine transport system substrate-binding protein
MVEKKISGIFAFLLSATLLSGCASSQTSTSQKSLKDKKEIKIGISQIVEHPALDAARKGFIDALKEKGFEDGKNIKIDFQNAQGDQATAQTIAQKFVSDKEDMILAIATPSAQAAYNATKDIPILITAVTDPVKAGLAKSMDKSETNVTGTSDNVPIEKQFDLLKKLVPNAKNVGIIYNTSESNSELQVDSAKKAAPQFGLTIVPVGVTSVNDIPQSLNSLFGKMDVLYVPTDNMVVSSMPIIVDQCFKHNIPIIGAESGQVSQGALATTGIDYYKLGQQTGLAAVDVINGKKPTEIPITTLSDMQLVINTDAAKKLSITIPKDIEDKAQKVTGGVK